MDGADVDDPPKGKSASSPMTSYESTTNCERLCSRLMVGSTSVSPCSPKVLNSKTIEHPSAATDEAKDAEAP